MAIAKFRNGNTVYLGTDAPKEPAREIGSIAAVVTSIYAIVNIIWPNIINDRLETAILRLVTTLGPLILAYLIRRKVWSPASVAEVLDVASNKTRNSEKPEPPVIL